MQVPQNIRHDGNPSMHLILFFLLLLLSSPLYAQTQHNKKTCGVYHKPSNEARGDQSLDLIDQFGNEYTFEELNIRSFEDRYESNGGSRNVSNCTGGDFILDFSGFTCDEETTICNVFQELSNIIDIGPNGSNPLIVVVKEPFENDDGSNDTQTLGVGITYFQPECGLANNFIFDVMYTDLTLAAGTASGVLRINDLLPFYNDVQGPVTGHYDLHTVALHEALHILGYSSLIADGGGTASGYYSRWDTHLYSENDQDDLITLGTNAPVGCCDFSVFNPSLNYNQVITADCDMDVFFRDNGQNIARAYGVNYPASNPGGLLSHLDRCGAAGNSYVMKAELDTEEEKDLTQEEIDILFALGYQADGGTAECNVIANNDLVDLSDQGSLSFIPYNQIFGNDALPDGFNPQTDVIFHTTGCGTIDDFVNANPIPLSTSLRIRIPLCATVELCYTIIGCDDECDDGLITIRKACPPCNPPPPLCEPADICAGENLFCYGDFEIFIPQTFGLSGQPPVFNLDIPDCPAIQGSPDVVYDQDDDNRMLGLTTDEIAIIPLSTPVQPGCTINISYRYAKQSSNATTVNFVGTSESFCDLNQIPACPGANCVASVMTSLGEGVNAFSIPCDNTTPPDIDCDCTPFLNLYSVSSWATINITPFVNNTSEPINFIQISSADASAYHLIDDLVITADCDNEVELTVDSPVDVCRGGEAEITVNVCITGTNTTPQDVTVTADFPALPGLGITPGSDFDGGTTLIANTIAGGAGMQSCYQRIFNLQVGYNIPVGSQLEVNFGFETANACSSITSLTTSMINVIDCDIPCVLQTYPTITPTCNNDGAIDVIVAGGSGNYNYQWSGSFGNTPSISGLAPGVYELMVTDAADPSCFVKEEFTVPVGNDCTTNCTGDGTLAIEHKVVQIFCLESEPGFYRYYIDMYIPNWPGTQTNTFELCSEDLFVTTPDVILESSEILLYQSFAAANIFAIIKVPINMQIDQGICFDTPVCVSTGQVCGNFCVIDFPVCAEESCELEVVPTITLSPTANITCGNLSGNDLYVGNVSLAIENANGISIDYVQYVQVTGNADPSFWQENNVPVIGGVANLSDQAICWKSYDNEYFCFKVIIAYSDGVDHFECEVNICLLLSEILSGMLDDGAGGERRQDDLSFQKNKNINSVFSVFPNPVNQNLNIQNPQQASATLRLMTLQGELLNQQVLNGDTNTRMKMNTYAPGIYLLQICDASSGAILQMEKIIVAH